MSGAGWQARARLEGDLELTTEMASGIWSVLLKAGLAPTDAYFRDLFLNYITARGENRRAGLRWGIEYRLLFARGIKFRADASGRGWRVDCYPEERTPDLDARIATANEGLAALEREITGGGA